MVEVCCERYEARLLGCRCSVYGAVDFIEEEATQEGERFPSLILLGWPQPKGDGTSQEAVVREPTAREDFCEGIRGGDGICPRVARVGIPPLFDDAARKEAAEGTASEAVSTGVGRVVAQGLAEWAHISVGQMFDDGCGIIVPVVERLCGV